MIEDWFVFLATLAVLAGVFGALAAISDLLEGYLRRREVRARVNTLKDPTPWDFR